MNPENWNFFCNINVGERFMFAHDPNQIMMKTGIVTFCPLDGKTVEYQAGFFTMITPVVRLSLVLREEMER